MFSLDDAMVRAEKLGRLAADKGLPRKLPSVMADPVLTYSGDGAGTLALSAYREFGEEGMRVVMTGYQAGYRCLARTLETDREATA